MRIGNVQCHQGFLMYKSPKAQYRQDRDYLNIEGINKYG